MVKLNSLKKMFFEDLLDYSMERDIKTVDP